METAPSVNPPLRIFFSRPTTPGGRVYSLENVVSIENVLKSGTKSKIGRPSYSKNNPTRKRVRKLVPSQFYMPYHSDTEYQSNVSKKDEPKLYKKLVKACQEIGKGSIPITVQMKGIFEDEGSIFLCPEFAKLFPEQNSGIKVSKNLLVSYFEERGIKARFMWYEDNEEKLKAVRSARIIKLDVFAHFGVADIYKMWCDERMTRYLLRQSSGPARSISQKKYLKIGYKVRVDQTSLKDGKEVDTSYDKMIRFIKIPAVLELNGVEFALELGCVDTVAMGGDGVRKLTDFQSAAGRDMDVIKDYYSSNEKGHMLQQFVASEDPNSVYVLGDTNNTGNAYSRIFGEEDTHFRSSLVKIDEKDVMRPFIDYAMGDVSSLHSAIVGFGSQMKRIYAALGIPDSYVDPAPTIGSTVAKILLKLLLSQFNGVEIRSIPGATEILKLNKNGSLSREALTFITKISFDKASAVNLSKVNENSALLAKVLGGRVISKSAIFISGFDVIPDLDVSGAYPWAMKSQPLPLGNPIIWPDSGNRKTEYKMPTLTEFFEEHGDELVDGCWKLLFSVLDDNGKPYPNPVDQDFFPTWQPSPSYLKKADSPDEVGEWVTKTDRVRYYRREILNTPLTSDSKDILDYVICEENRKHIMKNGRVIAYMYYPKSHMVSNTAEFVKYYILNSKLKGKEEFRGWLKFDVGELISDELVNKRGFWKKRTNMYKTLRELNVFNESAFAGLEKDIQESVRKLVVESQEELGIIAYNERKLIEDFLAEARFRKKHPLDTVFKTVANTIFGDLTSKFFAISLPICGEGITSRVRCLIYMFETALRATNVITDGGFVFSNSVNYPFTEITKKGDTIIHPLTDKNTFASLDKNTQFDRDRYRVKVAPLGGYDKIQWEAGESNNIVFLKNGEAVVMNPDEAKEHISRLAENHIRQSFPKEIKILSSKHKFKLEAKGIVKGFANHGSANYYLEGGYHENYPVIKNPDETETIRRWAVTFRSYMPDFRDKNLKEFFSQLLHSPNSVIRSLYWDPEYRSSVLTVEKYAAAREVKNSRIANSILEPGDSEISVQIFREFTPSVFRYFNREQEKSCENFTVAKRDVGNPYGVGNKSKYYGQSYEGLLKPAKQTPIGCPRGKEPAFIKNRLIDYDDEGVEFVMSETLAYQDMLVYINKLVNKRETLNMNTQSLLKHPRAEALREAKLGLLIDWANPGTDPTKIKDMEDEDENEFKVESKLSYEEWKEMYDMNYEDY